MSCPHDRHRPHAVAALVWLAFQLYIILYPLHPMIQRPVHVFLAVIATSCSSPSQGAGIRRILDWRVIGAALATMGYYLLVSTRLVERMENVDPVLPHDMLFGVIAVLLILEATRRVIGWSLLSVILGFLAYGFLGPWFPGWLKFQGFDPELYIEILTMTGHGLMGITTETSVTFVFYFIAFGAVYSATGGGQLFIDLALRGVGRQKGGAAKSAVISSALFGTISGSAVANVVATGVFTIPLMKKTGYSPGVRRRARGHRLDRRPAHAAGHGHRRLRHGRTAPGALRPDRAGRGHPGHRLLFRPLHDRGPAGPPDGHRQSRRRGTWPPRRRSCPACTSSWPPWSSSPS